MRLITHNLLACHVKTCKAPSNFPLRFVDCTKVEVQESEFNAEFLRNFLPKLDWPALVNATRQVRRSNHRRSSRSSALSLFPQNRQQCQRPAIYQRSN